MRDEPRISAALLEFARPLLELAPDAVFVEEAPIGLQASPGDVVSVSHQFSFGVGRAWGCLVDA